MRRTLAASAIYTAKRCSIHNALHIRSSALDAQVGNCISNRQALRHYHPSHICARAKGKSSRNRAPIKRDIGWLQKELSKGNVPEYATNPYRSGAAKKTAGGVRVVLDELKWPLDADIDERFAKRIRAVRLARFRRSDDARKRCAYFGISEKQFSEWSHRFSEAVLEEQIERMQPNFLIPLLIRSRVEGLDNYIVNQFFAYLEDSAPQLVKNIKYLREITDLRFPQEWAPGARKIQRRIIMHVGPTNSGKTYHALQRLQNTTLGVYCSPLRLLAHEVYSRMMSAGITCGLITGEDRRFPDYEALGINPKGYSSMGNPLTQIIACTIEMLPMQNYNVAVIDEIQMISDPARGWAWTGALLGLNAREIHLCGEPSAVPLVKQICGMLDEEVEVREYTRLGELEVSKQSLEGDWKNIRNGDCVVVFSRQEIYAIKNTIEEKTGMKCAVIYGGLPPESRVQQAELFNDPDSEYGVLVASDAVGMGINLSINRVVFTTLRKFDGESVRPISVSQVRQIGGRAGRFNSRAKRGLVTTMEAQDIRTLAQSMAKTPPQLQAAGLKPTAAMIEMFSHQFPRVPFEQLWSMFRDICNVEDHYFLCSFRDQEEVAKVIEDLPLSVGERFHLIYAPVNPSNPTLRTCLHKFASAIAHKQACQIRDVIRLPSEPPKSRVGIQVLENWHRAISLYMWLSFHYTSFFPQIEEAQKIKAECEASIQTGLAGLRTTGRDSEETKNSQAGRDLRRALALMKHRAASRKIIRKSSQLNLDNNS